MLQHISVACGGPIHGLLMAPLFMFPSHVPSCPLPLRAQLGDGRGDHDQQAEHLRPWAPSLCFVLVPEGHRGPRFQTPYMLADEATHSVAG